MNRKVIMVDEKAHRALAIVAARKGTKLQVEAGAAILAHVERENKRMEQQQ